MKTTIFSLSTLAVAIVQVWSADIQWQVVNPRPVGNSLNAVTFGNGMFVAVDADGAVVTSQDGLDWTKQPIARGLKDITFAEDLFVTVGANAAGRGRALTSRDAIRWTGRPFPGGPMNGIAYGNGRFVAVGDRSICASGNGINWSPARSTTSACLFDVAFGDGKFLAVGTVFGKATPRNVILSSANGFDWTAAPAPESSYANPGDNWRWRAVGYGNDEFIIAGDEGRIFTSPTGGNWTEETFSGQTWGSLRTVLFSEGLFIAVGRRSEILTSSGDSVWRTHSPWNLPATDLNGVAYGNGRFVAVGPKGAVCASENGSEWFNVTAVASGDLRSVAYGNGTYVAVGGSSGLVLTSASGVDWVLSPRLGSTWLNGVAYGNGIFVTVGSDYGFISTSTDGVHWTSGRQWNGPNLSLGNNGSSGIAFGNSWFVAISYNSFHTSAGIIRSHDGVNWTWDAQLAGNIARLRTIIFADGNFVVRGDNGAMWHSSEGVNWIWEAPTPSPPPPVSFDTPLGHVNGWTYANGIYTGVGDNCLILQGR